MGKQTELFSAAIADDETQYQILIVEASGDDLVRLRAEKVRPQRYGPGKGRKPRLAKKALVALLLVTGCTFPEYTFEGDGAGGETHEADAMGGEGGAP